MKSIYQELIEDRPLNEVIERFFDGDVDLAFENAERIQKTYAHPPRWVVELLGPPQGWRHPTTPQRERR